MHHRLSHANSGDDDLQAFNHNGRAANVVCPRKASALPPLPLQVKLTYSLEPDPPGHPRVGFETN